MSAKFEPVGEPWIVGDWSVQEERRVSRWGPPRYRISRAVGEETALGFIVSTASFFDLVNLLDDVADDLDERGETG